MQSTLMTVLAVFTLVLSLPASAKNYGPTHTVKVSAEPPRVAIGGTVVPYKEVTLAAQLPGRVKYLAGIEGDAFKGDALLVALDDTELLAKRSAALAQLAAADAQMRNAGVQYNRELYSPQSKNAPGGMAIPNLFDQMFTRPAEEFFGQRDRGSERGADLYASTTRIEQARSALLRVQSEIQGIDAKLRDAKSLAPFDGVIMQKFIEVGDTVQPGQPMLKFADVTWLQVEVDMPSRLVQGLREMEILKSAATFDDYQGAVDVRVAQIFPMADAKRHTVKVKFDIPHGVSAPGIYAKVQVPDRSAAGAQGQLPVIPSTAIRYRGSLPVVYVMGGKGEPELRLIREGRKIGEMTTVLSGLAEGDQVLVDPGPDVLGDR